MERGREKGRDRKERDEGGWNGREIEIPNGELKLWELYYSTYMVKENRRGEQFSKGKLFT